MRHNRNDIQIGVTLLLCVAFVALVLIAGTR